jgi:hypothetical protein
MCLLWAASSVWAGNAAPLGMEIGVATLDQVKREIGGRTRLADSGTSAYSDGPMLKGNGEGLDVDGLSEITFIFDADKRLAGVVMTLPKGGMRSEGVQRMVRLLGEKYKLVRKEIPFVGNAYARFKQGNSTILLDAPHMSFSMDVSYLSDALLARLNQRSAEETQQKQKKQQSQF